MHAKFHALQMTNMSVIEISLTYITTYYTNCYMVGMCIHSKY